MSFLFSNEFLNELRNRINVSDIVGRYVKLRRAGAEYEGLCPFHNEKTPSFTVNDQKGFYHCFGCGAHGDIIKFLVESQGYKFVDAVEDLAKDAGIPLPKREEKSKKTKEQLSEIDEIYKALEAACDYYQQQLKSSNAALEYIETRGISQASIDKFRIGYISGNSDAQINYLKSKGFTINILEKAGLLSKRDGNNNQSSHNKNNNNYYAKFRNRIMFPIVDQKARVIAFGGRVLSKDDKPKYLNSPETGVFHKGYNLYAQHLVKKGVREKLNIKTLDNHKTIAMPLIICEGYTDVISLYQAGLKATVAPLGTAITEDQLRIMWRFHNTPLFCLDGDNAGYRAAIRVCERAIPIIKTGQNLQFSFLPQGEDPDTYIKNYGADAFINHITKARMDMFELLWKSIYHKHNKGQSVSEAASIRRETEDFIEKTTDKSVGESLKTFFKSKIFETERSLFRGNKTKNNYYHKKKESNQIPSNENYGSVAQQREKYLKQKLLLILASKNPEIVEKYNDEFFNIKFDFKDLSDAHQVMCNIYDEGLNSNDRNDIYEMIKEKTDLFQDRYGEMLRINNTSNNSPDTWKAAYDNTIYLRDLRNELKEAKATYNNEPNKQSLEKIETLFNIIREFEEKEGELILCNNKEE